MTQFFQLIRKSLAQLDSQNANQQKTMSINDKSITKFSFFMPSIRYLKSSERNGGNKMKKKISQLLPSINPWEKSYARETLKRNSLCAFNWRTNWVTKHFVNSISESSGQYKYFIFYIVVNFVIKWKKCAIYENYLSVAIVKVRRFLKCLALIQITATSFRLWGIFWKQIFKYVSLSRQKISIKTWFSQ